MTVVLVIVLIALGFGFLFAKLDGLSKMYMVLKNDIQDLQKQIQEIENKK